MRFAAKGSRRSRAVGTRGMPWTVRSRPFLRFVTEPGPPPSSGSSERLREAARVFERTQKQVECPPDLAFGRGQLLTHNPGWEGWVFSSGRYLPVSLSGGGRGTSALYGSVSGSSTNRPDRRKGPPSALYSIHQLSGHFLQIPPPSHRFGVSLTVNCRDRSQRVPQVYIQVIFNPSVVRTLSADPRHIDSGSLTVNWRDRSMDRRKGPPSGIFNPSVVRTLSADP